ncbi:MAG: hypothetical protein M3R15_17325 [Acidobacteriota bacterium]|nr:hypothetical protein [Acidobacteriota bacterium]
MAVHEARVPAAAAPSACRRSDPQHAVNQRAGRGGARLNLCRDESGCDRAHEVCEEYATAGIRVNALIAGGFRTPMLERVFERAGNGDSAAAEAAEGQITKRFRCRGSGAPKKLPRR